MASIGKISKVCAAEVLDSRGNPTVEACVMLEDGTSAGALVPSGASTGKYEAFEKRDGDKGRYGGKGTLLAVENVNTVIASTLCGMPLCQTAVDFKLICADGKQDKSNLGANAVLAVSLAAARAGAQALRIPLYKYIGGINAVRLPVPMMNILNGGVHAKNDLDVQEVMIVPEGFDSFSEALRAGCEIYHTLGDLLSRDSKVTSVGDEGGFAPDVGGLEEAIEYILTAIERAGYSKEQVKIAIDAASGEWWRDGMYYLPKAKKQFTSEELCAYWERLCDSYPIVSIEDGLGDDDISGWQYMTERLGKRVALVGDDLFVTDTKRLKMGIEKGIGNAILIKPNQVGTLSETLEVMRLARENGYRTVVSHRSGDTEDTTIADIAVGMNAGYIKCGAPARSERVAKYNRLLRIEAQLSCGAVFSDNGF
ncbi:MAG: phosphopyruvate hydratase [Ruminococcaceae bacterium]|nr:phosphopyruvate hydratase [Oscillospiraceae bacterium]